MQDPHKTNHKVKKSILDQDKRAALDHYKIIEKSYHQKIEKLNDWIIK